MANGDRSDGVPGSSIGVGPDPTPATGAVILREITMLEQNLGARIAGVQEATQTRFEAMDKAITILAGFPTEVDKSVSGLRELIEAKIEGLNKLIERHQYDLDRVPAMRNEAVEHLNRLVDEKFVGIATQFKERDNREDAAKREAKEAIAAALQAQKEAVGKTETGFEKRIDQIGTLITTLTASLTTQISAVEKSLSAQQASNSDSLEQQIGDIKDRVTTIESTKKGGSETWGFVVGMIGIAGVIVSIIIALVSANISNSDV